MALVLFANTKGGSGKTTASLVFANEMLNHNARVIIFEGDPNAPLKRWMENRELPVIVGQDIRPKSADDCRLAIETASAGGKLVLIHDSNEERLFDWIEAATAWANIVVADPEGSPNQWLQDVALNADLVIIPFAPTALDAHQVTRTVQMLGRVGRRTQRAVPYRVLMTRCGAIRTRDERKIRAALAEANVPVLETSLRDRPAYRAIFDVDANLRELSESQVNGLDGARQNAAMLCAEIGAILIAQTKEKAA